jgi:crotonobetainyl-CoA:carnitine CoA-transferase CaiB-like acyl-CoA transferase
MLPLAGLRVLDLVGDPMAAVTRHYAELGADVVRIEPIGGASDRREGRLLDGASLDFVAANLGKRASTSERLEQLAAGAVLVVASAGAVDADALPTANPALVVLSISDFGDTGRFADWVGSEAVFHALTGELSRSGIPGRAPLPPPDDLGYACAAGQAACIGLLACWQALMTGVGDHHDFSVLDGMGQALDPGYGIGGSANAGVPASELPRGRPDARFMYPIVRCLDGYVRLCVLAPRQWQGLFEWMGRPEDIADPSFQQLQVRFASKPLQVAMERFCADRAKAQIEAESREFGVPAAALLDLSEALANEHLEVRGVFVPVALGRDAVAPVPNGVIEIDGARMGIAGPVPGLPSADIAWRSRPSVTGSPGPANERPLAGLRVLDFGVIVVGAESGRLLADQGADVIKVEISAFPDGGRQKMADGPISPGFATGHRNKRSLGLNLRDPKGREVLMELVRGTDVILANFKGGTLEAFGLDYAPLKAINPRVIVCDSSAHGASGPDSRRMGYGPLIRAASGLTMQWRYPDHPDSFSDAITVYPDHIAARVGLIGVLALLIRRQRTGLGGQVGISQAEVMLSHMAAHIAADALGKTGQSIADERPRSAVHPCAGEDEWCVVTVRHDADARLIDRIPTAARWLPG